MIWTVNRDGSRLQQIAGSLEYPAGELGYTAWSPDGTRMAVTLGPDATARVHIFDPRVPWDQQRSQVLPPYGQDMPFVSNSWSPDGRRLAGVARVTPRLGIVAYSFDTKRYEVLSPFGEWPTWLSDSRNLLFVAGGNRILQLDSQTKEVKEILSVKREVLGPPRPTRDDRQIYFSRRMTEADIWLLTRQ
jgi:Tol biopolymer transport system component